MNHPFNVLRHVRQWERAPRDPVTIGTAIVTGLGGSAALAGASIGFGLTFAGVVGYLATTAITSWALSALTPKPDLAGIGGSRGTLVNSVDPAAPHEFVYGLYRKGGIRTYTESTGANNKFLHMIITVAGHEIEEFVDFYINDEIVTVDGNGFVTSSPWNSKIRIKAHRGNQTAPDPDLLAESEQIGSNFIGRGIAYMYVRLEYDQDVFANGIPLFTALVKGRKVYDPRSTSTAYSANAALVIRDYLTADFGLNDPNVDDVSFAASANVCDEDVSLAGVGSEKRYEANGVVSADMTPQEIVNRLITSCAGTLFWGQGNFQLKAGYYTNPIKTFTLDDFRSNISIDTRIASRDNFNRIVGTFADADVDYIVSDFPAIESATFEAEDNGIENTLDLQLPFTTSAAMAQRLAKLTLYRGREQITVSADFGLSAFGVQAGDVVALTIDRYGWDAKTFEVTAWNFKYEDGDLRIAMTLRETSSAAFDWNAEEQDIIRNNTNLLPFYDAPAVGISAEAVAKVLAEKLVNQLVVNVTSAASERVSSVEVQYRPTGDTIYVGMGSGPLGSYTVLDLPRGQYDIRARAINPFGYKGAWEYLNAFDVDALSAPPADVTGFSYELSGGTLFFTWEPVPDLDLSYYEVRYSPSSSGVTWGNSQFAIKKIARPATTVTAPARSGTWSIKAFDKGGNESVNMVTIYVSAQELPPLGTSQTLTEDPTFTGTKTNSVVDTTPDPDELILNDRTSATSNTGEYAFHDIIDAGSSRVARITGTVTMDRYYPDAGLWSKIHGTWTSWPDNFSTWTDEQANFGDYDVQIYAATSDDNVTYGAWTAANGQELVGRYFKFKAVLTSTNLNVSPAIKTLSAEVAY